MEWASDSTRSRIIHLSSFDVFFVRPWVKTGVGGHSLLSWTSQAQVWKGGCFGTREAKIVEGEAPGEKTKGNYMREPQGNHVALLAAMSHFGFWLSMSGCLFGQIHSNYSCMSLDFNAKILNKPLKILGRKPFFTVVQLDFSITWAQSLILHGCSHKLDPMPKADSCGIQTGKLGIKIVHGIEFYQCKRASLDEVAWGQGHLIPRLLEGGIETPMAYGLQQRYYGAGKKPPKSSAWKLYIIFRSFKTLLQHLLSGFVVLVGRRCNKG